MKHLKKKSPLRILLVSEESHIGGAATAIEEIANQMSGLGHRVTVVQFLDQQGKNWGKKYFAPSIIVENLVTDQKSGLGLLIQQGKLLWSYLSQLSSKDNSFDVVYLNYAFSGSLVCAHPNLYSTKKIFLFHGDEARITWSLIPSPKKHYYLGWLKRFLFSGVPFLIIYFAQKSVLHSSHFVVGFSKYSVQYLIKKLKTPKEKVERASLGVNTNIFFPAAKSKRSLRKKLGFSATSKVLLCTSRFETRKGILFLLEAFAQLSARDSSYRLILASPLDEYYIKSGYYQQVISFIENHGLKEKIHLVHNLSRKQLVSYYQASDLFILPSSDFETFGLVILEAFACGLPVVVYKNAGAPAEIVGNLSKILIFNHYQPKNLVKSIDLSFQIVLKDRQIHKKCYQLANRFSWLKTVKKLLHLATEEKL
jgi:glycosyltransferase involved in cell wall biosynthesis